MTRDLIERERVDFRLLELQEPFYTYVKKTNKTPSDVLRHFLKNGLEEKGGLTIEQQEALLNELIELRKQLSRVGGNLNQIARYFNQHEHLIESDLRKNLEQAKELFSETTETLKGVANVIR